MTPVARALAQGILAGAVPGEASADAIVDAAIAACVAPLLLDETRGSDLPVEARARLARAAHDAAAATALLDVDLVRAMRALRARGIEAIAIKGAHLAHALYRSPHLRPRCDIDLLIRFQDRGRAADALADAGFEPALHVRGSVLLGQFHFVRMSAAGGRCGLDVHWRPFAPLVLANAVPVDEVFDDAGVVAVGDVDIRVPSTPHALAIAILHHAAHHQQGWAILWLNDVRLLVGALTPDERVAFTARARCRRYSRIAAALLHATADAFDDAGARGLANEVSAPGTIVEASAALLDARRTPMRDLWLDVRVASWRDRLRLLREHALPSSDYMRASGWTGWLPLAYARRAVGGAVRAKKGDNRLLSQKNRTAR